MENILDQFYTNDDVVDSCMSTIEFDDYDIIMKLDADEYLDIKLIKEIEQSLPKIENDILWLKSQTMILLLNCN